MRSRRLIPWFAVALAATAVSSAVTQEVRYHLGAGAAYTRAAGSLGDYLAGGYGLGASLVVGPDRRPLSLRIDAEYLRFPQTTRSRPYRAGAPAVITTGSGIFAAVAGPRVQWGAGRVHLSAAAGAGFARLTNTGAVSVGAGAALNRATSFDDLTYALSGGGGAAVRIAGEAAPVRLDISARYLWVGPARWLREGNLPAGIISGVYLNPTWSVAAMWVYRLSITAGVTH